MTDTEYEKVHTIISTWQQKCTDLLTKQLGMKQVLSNTNKYIGNSGWLETETESEVKMFVRTYFGADSGK